MIPMLLDNLRGRKNPATLIVLGKTQSAREARMCGTTICIAMHNGTLTDKRDPRKKAVFAFAKLGLTILQ